MSQAARENGPLPREVAVRFIPIIRKIAHQLARRLPSHVSVDDLKGVGFIGLVDAYRRYDPLRGERFESYAEIRIRGAMFDELRAADTLTRKLRGHTNKVKAAAQTLGNRLGRAPTDAELADELGLSLEAYQDYAARAATGPTVSIDADAREGEAPFELQDRTAIPADEAMHHDERVRALQVALEALPPRLRQVIQLYYGDELALRDIGAVLGVTESRVSQLHSEAVQRIRARCSGEEGGLPAKRAIPRRPPVARAPSAK